MAPNLVSNPPTCREKADFLHQSRTKSPAPSIRIESVVHHVFCYLVGPDFFITHPTLSKEEEAVVKAFKRVTDDFKMFSGDDMSEMVTSLNYTPETIDEVFVGISNELFCEGITWARISAHAVFAGELASQCIDNDQPRYVIEKIFALFVRIMKDNLEKWISEHGGWEAFVEFSKKQKKAVANGEIDDMESSTSALQRTTGWARSAFRHTVRVLGTLANIANFDDLSYSFGAK